MRYLLATWVFFYSSCSPCAKAQLSPYLHWRVVIQNLHNSVLAFCLKHCCSSAYTTLVLILVGLNSGAAMEAGVNDTDGWKIWAGKGAKKLSLSSCVNFYSSSGTNSSLLCEMSLGRSDWAKKEKEPTDESASSSQLLLSLVLPATLLLDWVGFVAPDSFENSELKSLWGWATRDFFLLGLSSMFLGLIGMSLSSR